MLLRSRALSISPASSLAQIDSGSMDIRNKEGVPSRRTTDGSSGLLHRRDLLRLAVGSGTGLALVYPAPAADLFGFVGVAAVLAWQKLRRPVPA